MPDLTLVEFLQARISEDAGIAESVSPAPWHAVDADDDIRIISEAFGEEVATTDHLNFEHIARWDPARVLAECQAKRRIIDLAREAQREVDLGAEWPVKQLFDGRLSIIEAALRALAQPYASHEDFDPAWRAE